MLIDSLIYENVSPLNYHFNLELFYLVALELKHKTSGKELEKNVGKENLRIGDENPRQKRKLFNFKRVIK